MQFRRSIPWAGAVAGLAAVGVVATAGGGSAGAAPTVAPVPGFSHEVILDQQRAGFEPDVKIDGADHLYSSVPNGFSTTESYVWHSTDHGNSYRLTAGNIPPTGKQPTCAGGGDTELALDKRGDLFFSDLQGLSNLSNSVSTDAGAHWNFTCAGATNTPVDRMWYATHGSLGDPGFVLYEEYDAVASGANPSSPGGNQLVAEYSYDGVTWFPLVNPAPTTGCVGGGVANCVTGDEGISGNTTLRPDGSLLIAHTNGASQVVVSHGAVTVGAGGVRTATWKNNVVNAGACPGTTGVTETCGATTFATVAQDNAGNDYAVWSAQPGSTNSSGTFTASGPYQVFVSTSKDGDHWGAPVQVSQNGSNAFPWATADGKGGVAVAWYHANETGEGGQFSFDSLAHAEFSVQLGESLNAATATPHYTVATVSEHPIKYGAICTQGLGCTTSGGDRSLGDYLQVDHDAAGALTVVYVDDTSNEYSTGAQGTGVGGGVANAGPPVASRQVSGLTLLGTKVVRGSGPGRPFGSVTDPSGDAVYSANGAETPAGSTLDLLGSSITSDPAGHGIVVTMKLADLHSLAVPANAGGTTGEWITRFTTYDPGTPGNGHIYYAGMESVAGGAPRFFDGDTAKVKEYATFDSSHAVPGTVDPATGTITIHVPTADLGKRAAGDLLYSATSFTATTAATLAGDPAGLFAVTDSTTPYDYQLTASDVG